MRLFFLCCLFYSTAISAQDIGTFQSIVPGPQTSDFIFPSTHTFQKIMEENDTLSVGGVLPNYVDFTGYVPINGSSEHGYLAINSELNPGAVVVLDIQFDTATFLWQTTYSEAIDFTSVGGTAVNCSGAVTDWGTVISCEELIDTTDGNADGYNDFGWCVEVNPATKTVIGKRWALGNFRHENVAIHANQRTVYEGADANPGYLYKFVADSAQNLSNGNLYVFQGSKNGSGIWIPIDNDTPEECNRTVAQSDSANATVFNGIEDVEIGPDGLIYFAVKNEDRVYRFQDSDPLTGLIVPNMETFVGDTTYAIAHANGTSQVPWGSGCDNLSFDGEGRLWVMQDGDSNYIWVVDSNHTHVSPQVRIFGQVPTKAEPTGITFSPDYRFLFMSVMHPNNNNDSTYQIDAAGDTIGFDKDIALVIALKGELWDSTISVAEFPKTENIRIYPNPSNGIFYVDLGRTIQEVELEVSTLNGKQIFRQLSNGTNHFIINLTDFNSSTYMVSVKSKGKLISSQKIIKH